MTEIITAEEVQAKAHELAESVRAYVRNQKDLWNRVPWLALEADQRFSYYDYLGRAYCFGVLTTEASSGNGYVDVDIFVDLASGELIDAPQFVTHNKIVPAHDRNVLRLATDLGLLSAKHIVSYLEGWAKNAKSPDNAATREKIRTKLGLQKIYTADQRPKEK